MNARPFGSCQARGLLRQVGDQPSTHGSTRLVFGAIIQAGRMEAAPAARRQSSLAQQPDPGRRLLPLLNPAWLGQERADLLSASQVRALRLLHQGHEWAALETLRLGTWSNPEEELRQLLIHVHQKRKFDGKREEGA